MLQLVIDGNKKKELAFNVKRVLNAGFTGRNQVEVQKHIEEARKAGHTLDIKKTPIFIPKLSDRITSGNIIEGLPGSKSCGEAEPVLLFGENEIYVGVGSDHSDREVKSVLISKQIYPNVISSHVWRYQDVKDDWDNLLLQAWQIDENGQRRPYQEGRLKLMMRAEDLIQEAKQNITGDLAGMVLYLGTIATIAGSWEFAPGFEVKLVNERSGRELNCAYFVKPISWFTGEII